MINKSSSKRTRAHCETNHFAVALKLSLLLLILLVGMALTLYASHGSDSDVLGSLFLFWLMILSIVAGAIWESVDLINNTGFSSCCVKGRVLEVGSLCSIPWGILLSAYAIAPGLVLPIYNNLYALFFMFAAGLWQALDFILLIRAKSSTRSFLAILFIILPANITMVLFPLIFPAFLTLMIAYWQMQK